MLTRYFSFLLFLASSSRMRGSRTAGRVVAAVLTLFPAITFALTPFTLALDWYVNPDQAPILVAKSKGYFKQNGLNVKILTPTNVTEPLQLLGMQKIDATTTYAPRLVMDAAKGIPFTRIATEVPQPLDCITSLKSSGIKNPGDLKGKTIGYSSGAFGNAMLKLMLAKYHLTIKDVTLVDIKMNLIQALLSHRVAATAGMMRFVEPVEIEQMGYKVRIFKPENYGMPKYDELIIIANKKDVHALKYREFVKAITEGAQYLKKHPQKSWVAVSKTFKTSLAPTAHMAKINHAIWMASIPYFTVNPAHVNLKSYIALGKFLNKNHMVHEIPKPNSYLSFF